MNTYLKTFMDGLTAKVFRTYHACRKMQQELDNFICGKMHIQLNTVFKSNRKVLVYIKKSINIIPGFFRGFFFAAKKHQSYKISYCKDSIKSVAIFLNHQQAVTKKVRFENKATSINILVG